ncbi:unnamed protein product [Lupinus luteus]|uniref:Putative plant transposon protein domain-containing protein n=1 Tax=Lupinus luteus TaxID=3873 RepID=A0AAV1WTW7_LUPLU
MSTQPRKKSLGQKKPPPPKKLKGASSSQPPLELDRSKFRKRGKQEQNTLLLNCVFVPERKVLMEMDEYPEFMIPLEVLRWVAIASPHDMFDPEVVSEFYSNAYPLEGEEMACKSWVRGKTILFDRNTINDMLNNPYEADEGVMCEFDKTLVENNFSPAATAAILCIPRRSYGTNSDGLPIRIYRKHMTRLAQTWMILILHNILSNSHVSSLPLYVCYLIYAILTGMTINVAALISREIYSTACRNWKKGSLGYPSLITELCASQRVTVNHTEKIKPPINLHYILLNCKEEQVPQQGDGSNRPQVPHKSVSPQHQPRSHQAPASELFIQEQLAQIWLNHGHILQQNEIIRQGQVYRHQGISLGLGSGQCFRGGPEPSGIAGNVEDGDGGDEAADGDDDNLDFMI